MALWLIAAPAALGVPSPVPGASGAEAPGLPTGEVQYVLGTNGVERSLRAGDAYHGARVLRVNPVLHFVVVATSDPGGLESSADRDPEVRYAEPDPVRRLVRYVPDDPRWDDQYGPQQVRADEAWDTTFGDADASVCVADTGVRHTHEDLAGARWRGGHDYVNDDADPWDDNGHGTHVAGIAAATTDNALGIAGVAQVDLYAVKVLDSGGSGSWSQVAEGVEWCADNAGPRTVISLSLGGTPGQQVLEDAVDYAYDTKGMLVVAAAGNGGPCDDCVEYPAKYDNAIAVTCTTLTEAQCSYSSDGPESELAAPGDGVLSTCFGSNANYCTKSGTSMSTPHVSGVAALVWSTNTSLSNGQLRGILQDTAKDLGSPGWDEQFGHGLVDARAALDAADGPGEPDPPEQRVAFEDFDDGAADGWTLGGLWHVSDACSTPPSEPRYLGYNQDSDCEYSTGARTTGSAAFDVDLAGATAATLRLEHRWETESYNGGAYDIMRVQASDDGGASYATLRQWDSRDPNQLAWGAHEEDLDAYAGGTVRLRFFFDSVDAVSNAFEGWFLDDVEVTADLGGGGNQPPVAAAGPDQEVADADGSGDEEVALDGTGSADPDGTIASYEWREGGEVLATGAQPQVTLDVGVHAITLTVTDDEGATDTDDVSVTVAANQAPTASFSFTCAGLACDFDGSASADPDGSIASYEWAFGDGTTGSGVTASHAYGAAGTYDVTLNVTDDGGLADGQTRPVTVQQGEQLVYGIDFEDGAPGWHESSGSLWHLGEGCLGAHSPATSLQYNNGDADCDYVTGGANTGWARSPVVDLSGSASATLRFWHAWETESYQGGAYDIMRVQVSEDSGSTWTTLEQWDSRDPNQPTFQEYEADVTDSISSGFRVRFVFDTVDGTGNGYDGWHVDDVEVWAG